MTVLFTINLPFIFLSQCTNYLNEKSEMEVFMRKFKVMSRNIKIISLKKHLSDNMLSECFGTAAKLLF